MKPGPSFYWPICSKCAGNEPAAKKLAEGAIVVAQAMGYERLELHAREHMEGRSIIRQFQEKLAELSEEDEDVHLADESDEMLRDMARHTMASLELSSDRLPVLEGECLALRMIAQERVGWCRYIQMIQDLTHTKHPATHYHTDPQRRCVCEKHGYESKIESTDAHGVIEAFKQTYCTNAPIVIRRGERKG